MVCIFVRGASSNGVCLLPKEAGCVKLVELIKLPLELAWHILLLKS